MAPEASQGDIKKLVGIILEWSENGAQLAVQRQGLVSVSRGHHQTDACRRSRLSAQAWPDVSDMRAAIAEEVVTQRRIERVGHILCLHEGDRAAFGSTRDLQVDGLDNPWASIGTAIPRRSPPGCREAWTGLAHVDLADLVILPGGDQIADAPLHRRAPQASESSPVASAASCSLSNTVDSDDASAD